jgi:hypothetical protein
MDISIWFCAINLLLDCIFEQVQKKVLRKSKRCATQRKFDSDTSLWQNLGYSKVNLHFSNSLGHYNSSTRVIKEPKTFSNFAWPNGLHELIAIALDFDNPGQYIVK